jgi:hypothetical protein
MERFKRMEYSTKESNVMAMYEAGEAEVEEEGERIKELLIAILSNPDLQLEIFTKLAEAGISARDVSTAKVYFKPSEEVPDFYRGATITNDTDDIIVSFQSALDQFDRRTDLHKPNHHRVQRPR